MLDIDVQSIAWLGKPLLATGLTVALAAAGWVLVSELQQSRRSRAREDTGAPRVGRRLEGAWLAALVVVLAVGAMVRLTGLEAKGISHPEAYIPGLNLPASISEPPPRHGLVETAVWHFRRENHPLGYYPPGFERVFARGGSTTALIALLAIGPTLALFAASYVVTLTAPRVFLQFVPYLVLLAACGAWPLCRRRTVAAALAVVLGLTFAGSAVVLRRTPTSTRDYQGLARALASSMQPGDLVFTPARHWDRRAAGRSGALPSPP